MAAPSVVDVCNSALQKLGAVSITALTDNSVNARECSRAFDGNRRSEIRKHPWRFAIKRQVLSPLATPPAFDYLYQFQLPADCLRVIQPNDPTLEWVVEGRTILTNDSNVLNLRYLADIEDPTQWDSNFYDMIAVSLAMDLCERLTTSPAKKQLLMKEYDDLLAEARRNNAFERAPEPTVTDSFEIVRL